MVDKIRPLKLESSASGGTENDLFPSETQPSEDYISCKGISFEGSDNSLLQLQGSEIGFVDLISGTKKFKTLKTIEYTFSDQANPFLSHNGTTFAILSRILWRGTTQLQAPMTIRAIVECSAANPGEVRLYDLTNATILGTSAPFTGGWQIITISTSSWSANPSIIEVQVRRSDAPSGNARIASLSFEW